MERDHCWRTKVNSVCQSSDPLRSHVCYHRPDSAPYIMAFLTFQNTRVAPLSLNLFINSSQASFTRDVGSSLGSFLANSRFSHVPGPACSAVKYFISDKNIDIPFASRWKSTYGVKLKTRLYWNLICSVDSSSSEILEFGWRSFRHIIGMKLPPSPEIQCSYQLW